MLAVILLFTLLCVFSNAESPCEYKTVGDQVVIKLDIEKLNPDDHLIWKQNQIKVYVKKASIVKTKSKGFDIDRSGSLIIKDIQTDKSGTYVAEVFNSNGKLKAQTTVQLCVQEPASEPSVTVQCMEKGVHLSCGVPAGAETSVSWMKNGQKIDKTLAVLFISWSELQPGDSYSCTVSNGREQKSAKDVQPDCSNTGPNAENTTIADGDRNEEADSGGRRENDDAWSFLFGLDLWMVVLVAVAGGVFLVLVIICVVCICCRRRNKSKAEEEREFRLAPLMPDYSSQPDEQYMQQSESHRPSKSQRPLPPLPNP